MATAEKVTPITAPESKRTKRLIDREGGFRKVKPISDLMGITPNTITTTVPETITIKPEEVWIDGTYQRDIGRKGNKLILEMIEGFSWSKFKPPVLTRDNNGNYIAIDGQHTLIGAASHPGIDKIPAIFIPMKTIEEQASAFVSHNTAKINVTPIDLFFARLAEGDKATLDIYDVMNKNGIEIVRYAPGNNIAAYESCTTLATGTLATVYERHGKAKLNQVMEICAKCAFKPIRREHMLAITELLYKQKAEQRVNIEPKLLVDMILSLNDTESLMQGHRIGASQGVSKAKGLAIFYRNQYVRLYS